MLHFLSQNFSHTPAKSEVKKKPLFFLIFCENITKFCSYWQTKDILDLMEYLPQNLNALSQISDGIFSYKISSRINHYFNKNTLSGSKKNIKAHYDLGNDFYSLWLDDSMTYSSGMFYSDTSTLQEAQENKYQSILNLLNLKKGSKILEIGCGWGGFLEYASNQGFDVKGITISPSQFNYVKAKQKNSKLRPPFTHYY